MTIELSNPEDQKLVTLARGAKARVMSQAGAAVRDQDGRTYSGAAVVVGGHEFGAVEVAVALAIASGAQSLEAVCVNSAELSLKEREMVTAVLQQTGTVIFCAANGDVKSVESASSTQPE